MAEDTVPKLPSAPASWGQDYAHSDPLQLASDSENPARSRSPQRGAATSSTTSLLPVGPYVVPRRVGNLYEVRVPDGVHGPGKKMAAMLYAELLPDAIEFWAARYGLSKSLSFFVKHKNSGHCIFWHAGEAHARNQPTRSMCSSLLRSIGWTPRAAMRHCCELNLEQGMTLCSLIIS